MAEPMTPAVAPSPEPTTPAPTTPKPTVSEPTTPAEPVIPAPAPVVEPVAAQPTINPAQVPPVQPATEPPTGEPTTPSDPAAAPSEEGTRVVPKADGYKLPEGMPKEIGEFAHKNDMTQGQLDAALTQFGGYVNHSRKAEQLAMRSAGEKLIETWGDNSKYNLSLAKRALVQNDPEGNLSKALKDSGYGNHPAVLSFLYNIGISMKEGGFLKSAVNRPPGKKTTAQVMYPNLPSEEG